MDPIIAVALLEKEMDIFIINELTLGYRDIYKDISDEEMNNLSDVSLTIIKNGNVNNEDIDYDVILLTDIINSINKNHNISNDVVLINIGKIRDLIEKIDNISSKKIMSVTDSIIKKL